METDPIVLRYFAAVALLWYNVQHRELTPLDWGYLDAWHSAQIPLQAVLIGMRRSFASFKPATPGARIHTLAYCYPAIMDAWHEIAPTLADEEMRRAA